MAAVTVEAARILQRRASLVDELRLGGVWTWLAPAAVAALVLAATLGVWDYVRAQEIDAARTRFDRYVAAVTIAVSERLTAYEQLLRGADGLFQSSKEVDRAAWRDYVASLRIDDNYPGLQALGFARHLTAGEFAAHVEATPAEGFPHYTVWPRGERNEFAVVDFLEPFSDRNLSAFGYDMFAELELRVALERARDSGEVGLSSRLTLPRDGGNVAHVGFHLYLPVYRDGLPTRTISQRRTALQGYVFGTIRMDELMPSIALKQANDILLTIHDGRSTSADTAIYRSSPDTASQLFARDEELAVNGHYWTLRFATLPARDASLDRVKSQIVLLAGLAISLLLAFVVWALNSTRTRALALARNMAATAVEVEAKYRHPVEAAGAVLYVWHAMERRFTYVAPQIETVLGYAAAQWTDEDFWISRVHPDDREGILQLTRDLNARRIDRADEYRMITADGRTVWIRDIVKFDSESSRDTVYGVMLDVTEIKQAESALRESEEQFRSAMDHSSIGMALVAPNGRWLRVNRALCAIVGYSEAELLATDFQSITHPDDLDLDIDYVGRMLNKEIETYQMAKRYVRRDGSLVWILLSVSLVWNLNGTPRYFISQIQDISDRRVAEQALRESERRFRNLVESANVIPYAWDVLAKRYVYVGPQIERLFGQATDLWSDRSFWIERLHPDDREKIRIHSQTFARRPEDTQLEYRVVKPDGSIVWVSDVIKVESGDDGRLIGYGIIHDITQSKLREAQLQQALKMEAVGQLTSGIAHDFNNLLGVVVGNIDLMLNRLQNRDRPLRGLAEDALSAALLGADITKRLLAYSRRQPMHSEVVNLNELTMQTVALLRHTIGGAIVVRTRMARDLYLVEADPAQFESALTNLAINARDAMADGAG